MATPHVKYFSISSSVGEDLNVVVFFFFLALQIYQTQLCASYGKRCVNHRVDSFFFLLSIFDWHLVSTTMDSF